MYPVLLCAWNEYVPSKRGLFPRGTKRYTCEYGIEKL